MVALRVVITIVVALMGAALLENLRVPAGAMLGSMLAVAVLNVSSNLVRPMPESGQFLAFAAIGWLLGQGLNADVLRSVVRSPGLILGTVLVLLLMSGGLAIILARTGLLDPATAFLATSPGGLSQMSALAVAVDAQAAVVVTIHLIRVFVVVGAAPIVIRILAHF